MIKAVTYILENDTTVQQLVGGNSRADKHKVYPVIVPESERDPYIAVRLLSKETLGRNCGYRYNIGVTCYHSTYDGVTALNQAIIDALETYPSGNVNGVDFSGLNFLNESDEFMVDRIAVTHEHPLYAKTSVFLGMGNDGIQS
jgi:hypothetical protein